MRSIGINIAVLLLTLSVARSRTILTDIAYGSAPGQKLDVYLAREDAPLVILIRIGPDKRTTHDRLRDPRLAYPLHSVRR